MLQTVQFKKQKKQNKQVRKFNRSKWGFIFNNLSWKKQNSIAQPKLYIPSNLNIDLTLWHTQLIVCAVKC